MAYARRAANSVERIEQPAYPLVGGINIISGDKVPYAIQVAVGILAQNILRHALCFPALLGFTLEPGAGVPWVNMLSPVKRVQTAAKLMVEPGKLDTARMIVLFKQPERFPDYFARGVVAARFHFGAHEFLKLGSKRHVHG
jgi:hypothetical protein